MTTLDAVVRYDAIDPTWVTQALRRAGRLDADTQVAAVACAPCGTGQLADSYRFVLTYDGPGTGPASVFGKFASDDEASRGFGRDSGQYSNEIRFYQELAGDLAITVPTSLHAEIADNDTDFVLLLEDLTPARTADQLEGLTAEQAALVLGEAAALHASSWQDATLAGTEWLQRTVTGWKGITDGFAQTVADFPEAFGELVPKEDIDEAAKLVPLAEEWKAVLSRPRCLWHNDLRADNLLFDAQDGTIPIAVLDWQGVTYGNGVIDVAYFMATSLTTEVRRAHERELIAHYHHTLLAHGVTHYSAEECWADYRVVAIHPLQTGVYGLGAVKRSERGDRMWRNWIERSAAMTRDLDSFEALAARPRT